MLERRFPRVRSAHWKKIRSTNPLKRLAAAIRPELHAT